MYNIEEIKKNIERELRYSYDNLDADQYEQQMFNNYKLVVNFENNEVYYMEKNSYLNPQDENINNIEYFSVPNYYDLDMLYVGEHISTLQDIEEYYEREYNFDESELDDSFDFDR